MNVVPDRTGPDRTLALVREACTELGPTAADVMVNRDLHSENVVDGGGLDEHRARGWILLYTVDYWLWGLEVALTEEPVRCAEIVDWLLK